ncbi:MAG: S26 family signal peptidase [Planctomycetaceae bacterium]
MAPQENSPALPREVPTGSPGLLRAVVELGVALLILVLLFRSFLAGGYMIETGSMAPCLLGYHRQAQCPTCQHSFPVDGTQGAGNATCPNCGTGEIAIDELLLNDGDHLLVARPTYDFQPPRRWEVSVFGNPAKPREAYVKRLVGLPGETVHIWKGDLLVDGEIQTKSFETQRSMRVLVHDQNNLPDESDEGWRPRWIIETERAGWAWRGRTFVFAPKIAPTPGAEDSEHPLEWVSYRHWIREGGSHQTSVPLVDWPASLPPSALFETNLRYQPENRTLIAQGALSPELRDRLALQAGSVPFRQSLDALFESSHGAPIRDVCGYNHRLDRQEVNEIRDLMISARVTLRGEPGVFALSLTDGVLEIRCEFDTARQEVRMIDEPSGRVVQSTPLPKSLETGAEVDFSLWDRQALLAIDGKLLFPPHFDPRPAEAGQPPPRPARLGASRLRAQVHNLRLYRDVYYTDKPGERGVIRPLTLGPDEFFVLGDNSPVSRDSRCWTDGLVLHRDLLLGKPLVVHLPSRRHRLQLGGWQTEIRIPDPSRIRYIH